MYDDNKDGVLETITAGKMLMDLYRAMNKEFHPTATDIASYQRIFDRDNKGKITFEDMERFAVKYYCNEEWSRHHNNQYIRLWCLQYGVGVGGVWIFELENEKSDVLMRLEVICSRVWHWALGLVPVLLPLSP